MWGNRIHGKSPCTDDGMSRNGYYQMLFSEKRRKVMSILKHGLNPSVFADRVKKLRLKNDLLLKELGADLRTDPSVLSSFERGRIPSLRMAVLLAQYYDVSLDYLLGLKNTLEVTGLSEEDIALIRALIVSLKKKNEEISLIRELLKKED